ncbi:hypothetical protein R6Q57_020960 [Mikania cordata]
MDPILVICKADCNLLVGDTILSGAAYVYEQYVRPFYTGKQTINIWYVPRKKDVFSKPDDILAAAEKYIQEHGPDAFQEMIHRSDREARYGASSIFSEDDRRY